jgi:hypothetical protein
MHDHLELAAPEDAVKGGRVPDVPHNQFDRRGNRCAMSVTEIVEHGHRMSGFHEMSGDRAADISGAADH